MNIELLAVPCSCVVGGEPSGSGRFPSSHSGSVVFPTAVTDAVAHAGPPPEGLDAPGALSDPWVARGYTDPPVHLAPLDVARCGFLRFSAKGP